MESYFKKQLKSIRGNATVYTLAALLIVGFIGTALIKMAKHDVVGGADYYQATRARVAAKAGLQQFEFYIENLPDSIVQIVFEMAIDSVPTKWIIGDKNTYVNLFGNSEYRLQALSFDSDKFVMHVKSEARAGGSKATIDAFYELGNLEIFKDPGIKEDFALYIGDVNSFTMLGPIDIDGSAYISGNVDFDALASGSRFRGVFRTSNETNFQTWRGTYTFDTVAYFGTRVSSDGATHFNMMDKSGFDPRTNMSGSNNSFDFHGTVYSNANFTGNITLDGHGNKVIHNTAFNFGSPKNNGWSNYDDISSGLSGAKSMDIQDSLGLNKTVCMPDIDTSVISPYALKWSNLSNKGATEQPGWNEIDGRMANYIWQKASDAGKLWKGFAVLEIDQDIYTVWGSGDFFSKKLIVIIGSGEVYQPTSAARHFGTTADANLTLYVAPGGSIQNIGSWEFLRGYIYVDSGATCVISGNGSDVDPIVGALHAQDNATLSWYPLVSGVPSIKYDPGIITELSYDDFLVFPCVSVDSLASDSIKFIEGFGINERLLGINY